MKQHINFYFFLIGGIVSIVYMLSLSSGNTRSQVANETVIDLSEISEHSIVYEAEGSAEVTLFSEEFLFKSEKEGIGAIYDFLNSNPEVISSQVKGVTSDTQSSRDSQKVLPENFLQNAILEKNTTDEHNTEHFYFRQKIHNIPVYGSRVGIHLKNDNEVYGVTGTTVITNTVGQSVFKKHEIDDFILQYAKKESTGAGELRVVASEQVIVNKQLLNISDESTNHPGFEIIVSAVSSPIQFAKRYVVTADTKEIVYSESFNREALNRSVYGCTTENISSCTVNRTEGAPLTGIHDVDNTYQFLGTAYNYFNINFQRDSYNNNGSLLKAFSNITDPGECPNAFWLGTPFNYFVFCQGMAGLDTVVHEYAHAVIGSFVKLQYENQSGAIEEGFADVFSYAVDPDWTSGEDSIVGTFRRGDNPPLSPIRPGPDRLFSQHYICNDSDRGGVHTNLGVLVKSFYLASVGGTFNGCAISGIGIDKTQRVWYRAVSTYLSPTANYRNVYNALVQSCIDIYGLTSVNCTQIVNSLKAVEMDQQPVGTQKSPVCSSIAPKAPQCIAVSPVVSQPPPTSASCSKKSFGDANCDNLVSLVDFEIWRKEYLGILTTLTADFNADGNVSIFDFETWRREAWK